MRKYAGTIRSAILIAAMLVAQATAAVHIDVDDTHPGGDTCAFCVALGTLGAANVGLIGDCPVVITATDVSYAPVELALIVRVDANSIRGPPSTS